MARLGVSRFGSRHVSWSSLEHRSKSVNMSKDGQTESTRSTPESTRVNSGHTGQRWSNQDPVTT
ncbi:hypothetical protein Hdeb2414_s0001g00019531 [Helianthus debilis subsp. tardiflorus]